MSYEFTTEYVISSYFTFVYLTLFHYFIFQTLDTVSTNEFILTMHHDNNYRCEKNKLNFAEIIVS